MLVSFLKPEGNFKKNLSIFRLLLSKFELINNPKKGQPILGQDKTKYSYFYYEKNINNNNYFSFNG